MTWLLYHLYEQAELERDKAQLSPEARQYRCGLQPYLLLETRSIRIGLDNPVLRNRVISRADADRLVRGEPLLPAPTIWERLRKANGIPPHDHYAYRFRCTEFGCPGDGEGWEIHR